MLAYIGGFSRTRQLQPLLDAARLMSDVQIFIWGNGHQCPAVEAAATRYANVHYQGWLPADEVPVYFMAADAIYYCLVPGYPGWPNTLSNAMAAGRPIIANDVGDLGRIVHEIGCGQLLTEVTPEAICEAVDTLRSSTLRQQMGAAGWQAVKTRFNWTAAGEQLQAIYQHVIEHAASKM